MQGSAALSVFDLIAVLLTLTALFGWVNTRFVHLTPALGQLVMGLAASLTLVLLRLVFPEPRLFEALTVPVRQIDFTALVLNGMLAFLLFAGAVNVDLGRLRERAWPIAALALVGTAISTAVCGFAFWAVAGAVGLPVPMSWALVFGALISPTDPVGVLSTLREVRVPATLQIEMEGEALFNDGVGVVAFTLLLSWAAEPGGAAPAAAEIARLLGLEVGGGVALGLATGYLAYLATRAVDDFSVEVLITLALVSGTYALAGRLGASGPLAVVAAGLLMGDRAPRDAMSERTLGYVTALWTLVDRVLNAVLFLLLGLELVVLEFPRGALELALAAVPIVLVARLVAVAAPLLMFMGSGLLSPRNVPFLTWAGVRGGISVALALSLPFGPQRSVILAATYAVVLFTVIVQGSTLPWVARRTLAGARQGPA